MGWVGRWCALILQPWQHDNDVSVPNRRYCELKAMDTARVAAWTKLPAILAMLPCSDFVYHLDAGWLGCESFAALTIMLT